MMRLPPEQTLRRAERRASRRHIDCDALPACGAVVRLVTVGATGPAPRRRPHALRARRAISFGTSCLLGTPFCFLHKGNFESALYLRGRH